MSKAKTCGECRFYHPVWKHEGVCTATSDLRKTCDFTGRCAVGGVYPKPPLTNGDHIRRGGNRELAECCVYDVGDMFASTLIADKTFETYKDAVDAVESWLKAPVESEVNNGSDKCEYCGKTYQKKKKAQRFCSIECKDKWWNRERTAKLPDWCKAGEWAYSIEEKEYVRIKDIDEFDVAFSNGFYCTVSHKAFVEDYKQARPRPYDAEEMQKLVGKVLELDGNRDLVTSYDKDSETVYADSMWMDADKLLSNGYTVDGKPCVKLVHKDGDDWVE